MAPPPNLDALLETRIYPGMSMAESRILRSWIARHGAEWERRTRARPDAICTRLPNVALIIEAKEQATSEAVWQVLGYADLYRAEEPRAELRTLIVCAEAHPTAVSVARGRGVQILKYLIPPEEPLAPGTEAA